MQATSLFVDDLSDYATRNCNKAEILFRLVPCNPPAMILVDLRTHWSFYVTLGPGQLRVALYKDTNVSRSLINSARLSHTLCHMLCAGRLMVHFTILFQLLRLGNLNILLPHLQIVLSVPFLNSLVTLITSPDFTSFSVKTHITIIIL